MRARRVTAAVAWMALLVIACGRKTIVRPPELVAPARIANLSAANGVDGIHLAWRRPTTYVDGSRMSDLGAFRIERSSAGAPFVQIAIVAITDRNRLRQERRMRWTDADVTVGETYAYRVISITTDEYVSDPSNVATIERAMPTPAPPGATPTRVRD
jgi:hypothetical protein